MKYLYSPHALLKKIGLFFIAFLAMKTSHTQSHFDYEYARIIGNNSQVNPWSMIVDDQGNTYMCGTFADILDADPGPGTFNLVSNGDADNYVIKLDSAGQFLWAFNVGNNANGGYSLKLCFGEPGTIIMISADLGIVDYDHGGGTFNLGSPIGEQTLVAAKYDAGNGDFIDAFELHEPSASGGPSAFCYDAQTDASGDLVVCGAFIGGTLDFNAGPGTENHTSSSTYYSLFFGKYSAAGNLVWIHSMGGFSPGARAQSVDLDASGNIYTTGSFGGTIDFDPGAGTANLGSGSGYDMYIAKYTGAGNFVWAKGVSSSNAAMGRELQLDHNGDILIAGYLYGTADFDPSGATYNVSAPPSSFSPFLAKYDPVGNFNWVRAMPCTSNSPFGNTLAIDSHNQYYMGGSFINMIDLDAGPGLDQHTTASIDGFVAKYTTAGDYADGFTYAGNGNVQVWDMEMDANNNLFVSSSLNIDTLYFDDDTLFPAGSYSNAFVVKYAPGVCLNFTATIDSAMALTCSADGFAQASASGGAAPYTFSWNTSPAVHDSLVYFDTIGIFTVTVSDTLGCMLQRSVIIDGPLYTASYDLSIHAITGNFVPGQHTNVTLDVANEGCVSATGQYYFVLDPLVSLSSSTPAPDLISDDTLYWNFAGLNYNTGHIVTHLVLVTDTTAVLGDTLWTIAGVLPATGDVDSTNNFWNDANEVQTSFDPNDKSVFPQGECEEGFIRPTQKLTYTVRFQNTGTFTAFDIYVLDSLSAHLNLATLNIKSSSHNMITEVLPGNILKFRFDNINLPDSTTNEALSHGYLVYEIYPQAGLTNGTEITNEAYIYFDYNEPVLTNQVKNTISPSPVICASATGLEEMAQAKGSIKVYPNPNNGNFSLELESAGTVYVYSSFGQLVHETELPAGKNNLSLTALPKGIYLVKVVGTDLNELVKIIKQ